MVIIIRIAVAAVLIVLAISFLGFAGYDKPKDLTRIETAIVFSGADERVRVGLELLKAGLVKRLYISGANPNAGIWLNDFEKKFGNGEGNMRPLLECCIQFGALADTTFQNALETRCWLENQGLRGPILLITSTRHMPRARAALGHLLPLVEITPYPVPEGSSEHIGVASAKNHRLYEISRDRRAHGAAQLGHPPGSLWPFLQWLSRWR